MPPSHPPNLPATLLPIPLQMSPTQFHHSLRHNHHVDVDALKSPQPKLAIRHHPLGRDLYEEHTQKITTSPTPSPLVKPSNPPSLTPTSTEYMWESQKTHRMQVGDSSR